MKLRIFTFLIFIAAILPAQSVKIPSYFEIDKDLSDSLHSIVSALQLDKSFDVGEDGVEQISLAVIDLNGEKPKFGGINPENFIYPAKIGRASCRERV